MSLWPRAAAPSGDSREVGARILSALDTLDADRRAVFLLVEAEGHTAKEAAAIVGASRPEQVRDNVKASGVRLEPELLARIDQVLGDVVETDPAKTESPQPRA